MRQYLEQAFISLPSSWGVSILSFALGSILFSSAPWPDQSKKITEQEDTIAQQLLLIETLSGQYKPTILVKSKSDDINKIKKQNSQIKILQKNKRELTKKISYLNSELMNHKTNNLALKSRLSEQISNEEKRFNVREEELEIVRQELQLQFNELQSKAALVNAKIGDINEWEKKKSALNEQYDDKIKKAEYVQRVDELMGQFSALQVDLDVLNECDQKYLYRYNEAKSILNHIRTLIQSQKLDKQYFFYVISNDSQLTAKNRKLCIRS